MTTNALGVSDERKAFVFSVWHLIQRVNVKTIYNLSVCWDCECQWGVVDKEGFVDRHDRHDC